MELAKELGVSNVHIEHGGRHAKVVGTYKGQTIKQPQSVREGERHQRNNVKQQLKRAMLRCEERVKENV